jgi:hypothetical protein
MIYIGTFLDGTLVATGQKINELEGGGFHA